LWRNPGASLLIRGYTAPAGTDARRMALAEERARYCRDYLVQRYEVSESRIRMEWFGARRLPLAAREGDWPARRAAELIIELFMLD
jgi:outer membrane protein OmpA-like peptidoglycan-associated protein